MAYEGIKVATIHQSSAAKDALLLDLAMSRKKTATVSRTPHAIVTRMTSSALGLCSMMHAERGRILSETYENEGNARLRRERRDLSSRRDNWKKGREGKNLEVQAW